MEALMGLEGAIHTLLLGKWPIGGDAMIALNQNGRPQHEECPQLLHDTPVQTNRWECLIFTCCEPNLSSLALTLFGVVHLSKPSLDLG